MNWYKKSWNMKNFFKGIGIGALSLPFMLIFLNMSDEDLKNLYIQEQGDEIAVKKELENRLQKKIQEKFDYKQFSDHIKKYEGFRNEVYDDGRGNATIGIGHLITPQSENIFTGLFGDNINYDDIVSGKSQLTDEQVYQLAEYDIEKHLGRARSIFPRFDTYPYYLQQALLNSVYRGDTGPKTIKLINTGKFREAAKEYLNRYDYNNAVALGIRGIKARMEANRDAMLNYANELEGK